MKASLTGATNTAPEFPPHCSAMTEPSERQGEPSRPNQQPRRRRAHTRSRDLERYAGLFARRTQVMRSSAMRDLMAITARPEVISHGRAGSAFARA